MNLKYSKQWCLEMAQLEGDSEVSAGVRFLTQQQESLQQTPSDELPRGASVFGRYVNLMRRKGSLGIRELAKRADIEVSEVESIEAGIETPGPRAIYQLANVFSVEPTKLSKMAGLTRANDSEFDDRSLKFAASSNPNAELSEEERLALEAYVRYLTD